jgi:hypothetical protein
MKEPAKNWLFYIPQLAALCFENHDTMTLKNDMITAGGLSVSNDHSTLVVFS